MSALNGTKARACEGKMRHVHRATAEKQKARLEKLGATRMVVYPCKHCPCYHVGHNPGSRRKR